MLKIAHILIFNPPGDLTIASNIDQKYEGSVRWDMTIYKLPDGKYRILETKGTYFWHEEDFPIANTPGECLDAFMKIEQSLIDSL